MMAYADIPDLSAYKNDFSNFTFLSMFGIKDPLRTDIPAAMN